MTNTVYIVNKHTFSYRGFPLSDDTGTDGKDIAYNPETGMLLIITSTFTVYYFSKASNDFRRSSSLSTRSFMTSRQVGFANPIAIGGGDKRASTDDVLVPIDLQRQKMIQLITVTPSGSPLLEAGDWLNGYWVTLYLKEAIPQQNRLRWFLYKNIRTDNYVLNNNLNGGITYKGVCYDKETGKYWLVQSNNDLFTYSSQSNREINVTNLGFPESAIGVTDCGNYLAVLAV